MNLDDLTTLKSRISRIAALFCALFLLFGAEGGIAFLRVPTNSFRMLPGESTGLTGPLAPGSTRPDHMAYESSSGLVSVKVNEVISGFWLGTKMWRGILRLDPATQPGSYTVQVFGTGDGQRVGANMFQVTVYADRNTMIADSKSFVLRLTGISPWLVSAASFGFVLLCCAGLFMLAGKSDVLMAREGVAEVYHVAKDDLGPTIYFGLGERNGVRKGSKFILMDHDKQPVEEVTVESVSETDALARTGPLSDARPGYLVRKI